MREKDFVNWLDAQDSYLTHFRICPNIYSTFPFPAQADIGVNFKDKKKFTQQFIFSYPNITDHHSLKESKVSTLLKANKISMSAVCTF